MYGRFADRGLPSDEAHDTTVRCGFPGARSRARKLKLKSYKY